MPSRRSVCAILLALVVLLAGCGGAPTGTPTGPGSTTSDHATSRTPTQPTADATTSRTTTPAYGPSLRLEATADNLDVAIQIYNSTFVRGQPLFNGTSRLDSGESVYLTNHLHGLDAARVVLSVNDSEVWNASLDLDAGYTVEVNETDVNVVKTVA